MPAQVSVLTSQDIQRLNVRNYSDLFSTIPGVNAYTIGQGQATHSFSFRGFSGAGGADVAIFIDGVPQNTPSTYQGSTGLSEISWLPPEAIERIEVIKGPFSALYGDFAMAGVINIITKKSQPSPSLDSYGGSFGAFRALGVLSRDTWVPTPYLVDEYYRIDGYRDNSQLGSFSSFNKFSLPIAGGILSLRYNYYKAKWGAPGYLVINDVKRGLVSRRRAYNVTDGGDQRRQEIVLNYAPLCGERGLYATAYVDIWDILRLNDLQSTGYQAAREDKRTYWGGRIYYNMVFGDVASLTAGGETRLDIASPQDHRTDGNRQYTSTNYYYDLKLSNWAWFLQGQIKPADKLKIVGGVRGDYFKMDAQNLTRPQNSGTGFPQIISPKIGAVLTPTKDFNIFGNVGFGFRSPSYLEVSPYSATSQKNFDLEPAKIDTGDVGFNVALFGNLYFAAAYYHTITQREIRLVNNVPTNIGDTLRKGYEIEAKFYPSRDVSVFASYDWVDATVINPARAGQVLVTRVPEHIIKGGIQIQRDFGFSRRLVADAYYQYTSGFPNYSGTSAVPIFGPDYDVYNFKLTYEGNGWSSYATARYQPREFSAPITFVLNNQMTFGPEPKWDLTSGLSYTF
ncbi:TonB-dependent receptor [Desulfomonile tiedjei]|nr:TonB-dependent receptor [Desulfomonile tiedjei]